MKNLLFYVVLSICCFFIFIACDKNKGKNDEKKLNEIAKTIDSLKV